MHYNIRGSVMITASHNPPAYNGFKISRENAVPVSYTTGLNKLEKMIEQQQQPSVKKKGRVYYPENWWAIITSEITSTLTPAL